MHRGDPAFREVGQYLSLATIALEMVVPILVGVFLDRQYGWSPWGALAGVVLGFVTGIVHASTQVNRQRDRKKPPSDESL